MGIHISMAIPKTVRQHEVYMSFWTRQKGVERVWNFKGEIDNTQVAEKVANKFLLGNSNSGTGGNLVSILLIVLNAYALKGIC